MLSFEDFSDLEIQERAISMHLKKQVWGISSQGEQRPGVAVEFPGSFMVG